jgi:hypothetical protein
MIIVFITTKRVLPTNQHCAMILLVGRKMLIYPRGPAKEHKRILQTRLLETESILLGLLRLVPDIVLAEAVPPHFSGAKSASSELGVDSAGASTGTVEITASSESPILQRSGKLYWASFPLTTVAEIRKWQKEQEKLVKAPKQDADPVNFATEVSRSDIEDESASGSGYLDISMDVYQGGQPSATYQHDEGTNSQDQVSISHQEMLWSAYNCQTRKTASDSASCNLRSTYPVPPMQQSIKSSMAVGAQLSWPSQHPEGVNGPREEAALIEGDVVDELELFW